MIPLVSLFWRLATFRIGPADVPGASALLPVMVLLFVAINTALRYGLSWFEGPAALGSSLCILAAWWLLLYVLLAFKNVRTRFTQTFVALLGVDTVITLLNMVPGLLALVVTPDSPITSLLRMAMVVLFVWDILAKGAIYREALALGPVQANLLAMCFAFGFAWMDMTLFAPPLPVTQ